MNGINIEKMILHILDSSMGMPILSEKEHSYNGDIMEFMTTHIEKIFNDINTKKAYFGDEVNTVKNLCMAISENSYSFVEKTKE